MNSVSPSFNSLILSIVAPNNNPLYHGEAAFLAIFKFTSPQENGEGILKGWDMAETMIPDIKGVIDERTRELIQARDPKSMGMIYDAIQGASQRLQDDPLKLVLDAFSEKIEDYNLIKMYERLPIFDRSIRETMPKKDQFEDEKTYVNVIRSWMKDNRPILDQIWKLDLDKGGLTVLPPEINFFRNLERLSLEENHLISLSNLEDLPALRSLYLDENPIPTLPNWLLNSPVKVRGAPYAYLATLAQNHPFRFAAALLGVFILRPLLFLISMCVQSAIIAIPALLLGSLMAWVVAASILLLVLLCIGAGVGMSPSYVRFSDSFFKTVIS